MADGGPALSSDERTRALDISSVETTVKYDGYLKQEQARAERARRGERRRVPDDFSFARAPGLSREGVPWVSQGARREERRRIPDDFPFARVPGLSREVVHRLSQVRPETLGQASRIPGVTPAAIAVLGGFLGRISV